MTTYSSVDTIDDFLTDVRKAKSLEVWREDFRLRETLDALNERS